MKYNVQALFFIGIMVLSITIGILNYHLYKTKKMLKVNAITLGAIYKLYDEGDVETINWYLNNRDKLDVYVEDGHIVVNHKKDWR